MVLFGVDLLERRMRFEAVKSAHSDYEWRVEAIDFDSEGECYLAVFSGPKAQQRAEEYAAWKNGNSPEGE